MVGAIWFVQIVHYPLLGQVGREAFAAYEAEHISRVTFLVGPIMLIEALSGLLLLWRRPSGLSAGQAWGGVALLAIIWLSTDFLQIPQHEVLALGFNEAAHRSLVASNWLRTAAWSARGLLVLWMAATAASGLRRAGAA